MGRPRCTVLVFSRARPLRLSLSQLSILRANQLNFSSNSTELNASPVKQSLVLLLLD